MSEEAKSQKKLSGCELRRFGVTAKEAQKKAGARAPTV